MTTTTEYPIARYACDGATESGDGEFVRLDDMQWLLNEVNRAMRRVPWPCQAGDCPRGLATPDNPAEADCGRGAIILCWMLAAAQED